MFQFVAVVTVGVLTAVFAVSFWDDRRHQQADFRRALKPEITPVERNMYYRKFSVARDLATEFLKSYPYSPEIYALRGAARAELGDMQGAEEDSDRALMMKPGVYWIYYAKGLAKLNRQSYAEALCELQMAEQCGLAGFARLFLAKAKCEAQLGSREAALSDCEKARSIDAFDTETTSLLQALQQAGKK